MEEFATPVKTPRTIGATTPSYRESPFKTTLAEYSRSLEKHGTNVFVFLKAYFDFITLSAATRTDNPSNLVGLITMVPNEAVLTVTEFKNTKAGTSMWFAQRYKLADCIRETINHVATMIMATCFDGEFVTVEIRNRFGELVNQRFVHVDGDIVYTLDAFYRRAYNTYFEVKKFPVSSYDDSVYTDMNMDVEFHVSAFERFVYDLLTRFLNIFTTIHKKIKSTNYGTEGNKKAYENSNIGHWSTIYYVPKASLDMRVKELERLYKGLISATPRTKLDLNTEPLHIDNYPKIKKWFAFKLNALCKRSELKFRIDNYLPNFVKVPVYDYMKSDEFRNHLGSFEPAIRELEEVDESDIKSGGDVAIVAYMALMMLYYARDVTYTQFKSFVKEITTLIDEFLSLISDPDNHMKAKYDLEFDSEISSIDYAKEIYHLVVKACIYSGKAWHFALPNVTLPDKLWEKQLAKTEAMIEDDIDSINVEVEVRGIKFIIQRSSIKQAGLGLFLGQNLDETKIPKTGLLLVEYDGQKISKIEADELYGENSPVPYGFMSENRDFEIDAYDGNRHGIARLINDCFNRLPLTGTRADWKNSFQYNVRSKFIKAKTHGSKKQKTGEVGLYAIHPSEINADGPIFVKGRELFMAYSADYWRGYGLNNYHYLHSAATKDSLANVSFDIDPEIVILDSKTQQMALIMKNAVRNMLSINNYVRNRGATRTDVGQGEDYYAKIVESDTLAKQTFADIASRIADDYSTQVGSLSLTEKNIISTFIRDRLFSYGKINSDMATVYGYRTPFVFGSVILEMTHSLKSFAAMIPAAREGGRNTDMNTISASISKFEQIASEWLSSMINSDVIPPGNEFGNVQTVTEYYRNILAVIARKLAQYDPDKLKLIDDISSSDTLESLRRRKEELTRRTGEYTTSQANCEFGEATQAQVQTVHARFEFKSRIKPIESRDKRGRVVNTTMPLGPRVEGDQYPIQSYYVEFYVSRELGTNFNMVSTDLETDKDGAVENVTNVILTLGNVENKFYYDENGDLTDNGGFLMPPHIRGQYSTIGVRLYGRVFPVDYVTKRQYTEDTKPDYLGEAFIPIEWILDRAHFGKKIVLYNRAFTFEGNPKPMAELYVESSMCQKSGFEIVEPRFSEKLLARAEQISQQVQDKYVAGFTRENRVTNDPREPFMMNKHAPKYPNTPVTGMPSSMFVMNVPQGDNLLNALRGFIKALELTCCGYGLGITEFTDALWDVLVTSSHSEKAELKLNGILKLVTEAITINAVLADYKSDLIDGRPCDIYTEGNEAMQDCDDSGKRCYSICYAISTASVLDNTTPVGKLLEGLQILVSFYAPGIITCATTRKAAVKKQTSENFGEDRYGSGNQGIRDEDKGQDFINHIPGGALPYTYFLECMQRSGEVSEKILSKYKKAKESIVAKKARESHSWIAECAPPLLLEGTGNTAAIMKTHESLLAKKSINRTHNGEKVLVKAGAMYTTWCKEFLQAHKDILSAGVAGNGVAFQDNAALKFAGKTQLTEEERAKYSTFYSRFVHFWTHEIFTHTGELITDFMFVKHAQDSHHKWFYGVKFLDYVKRSDNVVMLPTFEYSPDEWEALYPLINQVYPARFSPIPLDQPTILYSVGDTSDIFYEKGHTHEGRQPSILEEAFEDKIIGVLSQKRIIAFANRRSKINHGLKETIRAIVTRNIGSVVGCKISSSMIQDNEERVECIFYLK